MSTPENMALAKERERAAFLGRCEPIAELLSDPEITDVSLNEPREYGQPGPVWVDRVGVGYVDSGVRLSAVQGEMILRNFASKAHTKGETSSRLELNAAHPRISAQVVEGDYRIEGCMPPATRWAPAWTIRKYIKRGRRIADYVADGQIKSSDADELVRTARAKESMVIAGATGAGKTTLVNALLLELGQDTSLRVLTIEDQPELERPNDASLQLIVGPNLSYPDAVKSALRHNPDYIVLGEIRDKTQATEAVTAWDSDHPGIATIHVGSVERIPRKLLRFCRQMGDQISEDEFVDLVKVFVRVTRKHGRWVFDCRRLVGWDGKAFVFEPLSGGRQK